MKTCSKCGVEKEEREFSKDTGRKDGFCSWCKRCYLERRRYRRSEAGQEAIAERVARRLDLKERGVRCCPGCGAEKAKEQFPKDKRQRRCKECRSKGDAEYRRLHPRKARGPRLRMAARTTLLEKRVKALEAKLVEFNNQEKRGAL